MYVSSCLFKDIKKVFSELKTYAPVIEALTIARVITIVGLSTAIVLQDIWKGFRPFLDNVQELLELGIKFIT